MIILIFIVFSNRHPNASIITLLGVVLMITHSCISHGNGTEIMNVYGHALTKTLPCQK